MPTTNLCLTKHLDGNPVKESDLKIGLKIIGPSLTGGVLTYRCTSTTASEAVFKSIDKNWPVDLVMKFNAPDMGLEEFVQLSVALKNYCWVGNGPSDGERALVQRAHQLGYAFISSYTQAQWTEKGMKMLNELSDTFQPVHIKGYSITFNRYWMEWQLNHKEIGPCGQYRSLSEAISDAEKG